ncbi:uncharacterized protein [Pithys albifrons albifrons]|uniref:uncharacterized protein isoform X6 n=1 Tax=Pithys albifrons albifrons TaxID=3385563 RepID=UPI003A5CB098
MRRTQRGGAARTQPAGATPARPGCGSPFSVPRSPPRWGRPQRPRCSSSSSLLAGQVVQIQERMLCHVFVKQPGLYSLWADSGTVLIRSKFESKGCMFVILCSGLAHSDREHSTL